MQSSPVLKTSKDGTNIMHFKKERNTHPSGSQVGRRSIILSKSAPQCAFLASFPRPGPSTPQRASCGESSRPNGRTDHCAEQRAQEHGERGSCGTAGREQSAGLFPMGQPPATRTCFSPTFLSFFFFSFFSILIYLYFLFYNFALI